MSILCRWTPLTRLLLLLSDEPRLGVLECSRRWRGARNRAGRAWTGSRNAACCGDSRGRRPAAFGYGLTAFAVLEIAQGKRTEVASRLRPSTMCARCTRPPARVTCCPHGGALQADLQRVIDQVVDLEWVQRTSTRSPCRPRSPHASAPYWNE